MQAFEAFDLKYTTREITAWGGLALLKRMMDGMGLRQAIESWALPAPHSNRGYAPMQLIEQMIVSIWCGAARFVHADITRLDRTLGGCLAGIAPQDTKPLFACFNALHSLMPIDCKQAATAGCFKSSHWAQSP